MINIPEKIYLVTGLEETDEFAEIEDFSKLLGVCWTDDKVYNSDISFIREEKHKKLIQICKELIDSQGLVGKTAPSFKDLRDFLNYE